MKYLWIILLLSSCATNNTPPTEEDIIQHEMEKQDQQNKVDHIIKRHEK